MWDARMEHGVLNAFSRLWGTDELLVSFDCLNITLPNRPDLPARKAWEHIDQSPMKRGVHCVQGIINLSPNGPEDEGLVVYPGSHKLNDEFFDTHPDVALLPNNKDVYLFSKEECEATIRIINLSQERKGSLKFHGIVRNKYQAVREPWLTSHPRPSILSVRNFSHIE